MVIDFVLSSCKHEGVRGGVPQNDKHCVHTLEMSSFQLVYVTDVTANVTANVTDDWYILL